eukprot:Awhi_evm1s11449
MQLINLSAALAFLVISNPAAGLDLIWKSSSSTPMFNFLTKVSPSQVAQRCLFVITMEPIPKP